MTPEPPIGPGGRVGILGGGQLGRMLAMAAARMGLQARVLDPDPAAPAGQVCPLTVAAYTDTDAVTRFAADVDVVTFEFENVALAAIDAARRAAPVRPGRRALEVAQDRLAEKTFLNGLGLATAPWAPVDGPGDIAPALARLGGAGILKTRLFGYDGKGQARLGPGDDPHTAWAAIGAAPAILEGLVRFSAEISVIAARGLAGPVAAYDPGENLHRNGILHRTRVPARLPAHRAQEAALIAGKILAALDYVGVIGVELFVTEAGLLVNEIAPRVHNSGHWTQNACAIDQFEQHLRAVCGWPLGDPARHADAEMTNLLGDEAAGWAGVTDAALHLYGKATARPGRKMGHVNRVWPKGSAPAD